MSQLEFATSDDVLRLLNKRRPSLECDCCYGRGWLYRVVPDGEDDDAKEVYCDCPAGDRRRVADGPPAQPTQVAPAPLLIPRRGLTVEMVIGGGQTGADRAGHDAAKRVGLPTDGYCPAGRVAEDGTIPAEYEHTETGTSLYGERTALNVIHSSATLVLSFAEVSADDRSGTGKTIRLCQKHDRPCLTVTVHPEHTPSDRRVAEVLAWLRLRKVRVLNVAGPRESREQGLQRAATAFLVRVLGQEPPQPEPTVAPLIELIAGEAYDADGTELVSASYASMKAATEEVG